jgi:hypothetical protein
LLIAGANAFHENSKGTWIGHQQRFYGVRAYSRYHFPHILDQCGVRTIHPVAE